MFIETKARCFMEAAKCLNFTRAAEKLYISQSALSKNIAILEQEFGQSAGRILLPRLPGTAQRDHRGLHCG